MPSPEVGLEATYGVRTLRLASAGFKVKDKVPVPHLTLHPSPSTLQTSYLTRYDRILSTNANFHITGQVTRIVRSRPSRSL